MSFIYLFTLSFLTAIFSDVKYYLRFVSVFLRPFRPLVRRDACKFRKRLASLNANESLLLRFRKFHTTNRDALGKSSGCEFQRKSSNMSILFFHHSYTIHRLLLLCFYTKVRFIVIRSSNILKLLQFALQ